MNAKLSQVEKIDLKNFQANFVEKFRDISVLKMQLEQLTSLLIAFSSKKQMVEWVNSIQGLQTMYALDELQLL